VGQTSEPKTMERERNSVYGEKSKRGALLSGEDASERAKMAERTEKRGQRKTKWGERMREAGASTRGDNGMAIEKRTRAHFG